MGIQYAAKGCTKSSRAPQHTVENLLDRDFHADRPNEKRLTDVIELRYYAGPCAWKLYLSAILDLCDRRSMASALRDTNDTATPAVSSAVWTSALLWRITHSMPLNHLNHLVPTNGEILLFISLST